MEEIIEKVAALRGDSYKQKPSPYSQKERRFRQLEQQQIKRNDILIQARRLAFAPIENELNQQGMEIEDQSQDQNQNQNQNQEDENECMSQDNNEKNQKKSKKLNPYLNQLMFAEDFEEIPEDFEKEWKGIVCPNGKRCLVIASNSKTQARLKNGKLLKSFSSHLPGGSNKGKKSDYTILDCIFVETTMTFYVIDIMYWKSLPFYECDTEFRFFWLSIKLQEVQVQTFSQTNPYIFKPAQTFNCEPEMIQKSLENDNENSIDGLLFYHKQGHYYQGISSLCLWLKKQEIQKLNSFLNSMT